MRTDFRSDLHAAGPLLTVRELAIYLGVSEKTVRRLQISGRIPFVRVGRGVRFDPADVSRFVAARKE